MVTPSALICTVCNHEFTDVRDLKHCSRCGGVLEISYDMAEISKMINIETIEARPPGIWKYIELLPISDLSSVISLGEGGTTLHRSSRLFKSLGLQNLFLKDETTNPTGAFIDRGTSVVVSVAREIGFDTFTVSSSGNLAASLVAYCARAGLSSKVFVSQTARVDIGKLYQILAFGADIELVRNREEANARAKQSGSDAYSVVSSNPFFLEGMKTTAYEICEQMNWNGPDWIVAPMGNGGHLSMIWKAITELNQLGFLENKNIRLVGTQAKGCSPIVKAFDSGVLDVSTVKKMSTVANDIAFENPSCGHMALRAIRESNGYAVGVSDREILETVSLLARQEGIFAEPASATTIAALKKLVKDRVIDKNESVVCIITGMGLKYPEITETLVKGRTDLEYLLSRVESRRFSTTMGQTKISILRILSEGDSYGYGIWKRLKEESGLSMSIPTVYQHLSELTRSGLAVSTRSERTIGKRYRNYYTLSEKGKWTLEQLEKL